MKAGLASNTGRPSLYGPGALSSITLNPLRQGRRLQALTFDAARELAREVQRQSAGALSPVEVFAPCLRAIHQFLRTRLKLLGQAQAVDTFLAPYYGIMLERLEDAMRFGGETAAELPKLESHRPPGTTGDVDFMTRRQPVPVLKSHVNAVLPDTQKWEQQAAYFIDTHPRVVAFVKNAGLGLGIPYSHNGQRHEYIPDFVIRRDDGWNLIVETKGFDPLADVKARAAQRWSAAVNQDGRYGRWAFEMVRHPADVVRAIDRPLG